MVPAGKLVGPKRNSKVKEMPYESGMDLIHDTRRRFDIHFHLVAIAFLLFDVELLFLYPWRWRPRILRDRSSGSSWMGREPGLGFWRSDGFYFAPGRSVLFTHGVREFSDGDRTAGKRGSKQARLVGELVPKEQPLADAVCNCLLRNRVDGNRREQARHRPFRCRGVPL